MTQLESALRTTCAECQSAIVLNADNVRSCGCDVLWPRDTLKAFSKWTKDGKPRFNVLPIGYVCDRGHHAPPRADDREWIACRACHPGLSDEQVEHLHRYAVQAFASRPFIITINVEGAFFYGAKRTMQHEFTCGKYTATRDDAVWTIERQGVKVGAMFYGGAYPGKYRCSLTALVWSGPLPTGCSSPRSEHYGIAFDVGPHDSGEEALAEFARRADRLIAWREAEAIRVASRGS